MIQMMPNLWLLIFLMNILMLKMFFIMNFFNMNNKKL